ncbi:MAG: histidine--tRNA ligase [Acidimicrobiales bacterium]|nr:histidine--tRNA ligase [Acidimicrobiales bacterium]
MSDPTSKAPSTPAKGFKAPIGTHDVLAPESARWTALLATFAGIAGQYGYGMVHTPMFEDLGVFLRMGEGTDVVTKEMYDFEDKGGRRVALRPEGTASVVRAFVEHRPIVPWKAWYATPAFRYEKPQKGRYRQHHQVGIEVLGVDDPDIDVEVIALADRYLKALGAERYSLVVNSMGSLHDRRNYDVALREFLAGVKNDLADEDQDKVERNPLRVLDSKRRQTMQATADAPRVTDVLSTESAERFERVTEGLDALGIRHTVEPRLVRGLDYYTHTLFEFQSDALDSAQATIIGGGRYNGLAEALGGPETPGIGFGSGIERVLLHLDAEDAFPTPDSGLDVFVVDVTDGRSARDLTETLRDAGLSADRGFDGRSMKAQMKGANRSGARAAVIIGADEAAAGTVTLRDLRGDSDQQTIGRDDLVTTIRTLLETDPS